MLNRVELRGIEPLTSSLPLNCDPLLDRNYNELDQPFQR